MGVPLKLGTTKITRRNAVSPRLNGTTGAARAVRAVLRNRKSKKGITCTAAWPKPRPERQRRSAEALPLADSAIASAGVYAEMPYERAGALHGLGRDSEAKAELLHALDDPDNAMARLVLAQLSS